jgi:hypothetical protein
MRCNAPLSEIYQIQDDLENVRDVISSGMNWAISSCVEEFEGMIGAFVRT